MEREMAANHYCPHGVSLSSCKKLLTRGWESLPSPLHRPEEGSPVSPKDRALVPLSECFELEIRFREQLLFCPEDVRTQESPNRKFFPHLHSFLFKEGFKPIATVNS